MPNDILFRSLGPCAFIVYLHNLWRHLTFGRALETVHSVTGIHAVYIISIPSDTNLTPALTSNSLCLNILVENMLTVVVQVSEANKRLSFHC